MYTTPFKCFRSLIYSLHIFETEINIDQNFVTIGQIREKQIKSAIFKAFIETPSKLILKHSSLIIKMLIL